MTLLPKVKLKSLPTFPANIVGGTGLTATKQNGAVTLDFAWQEFGSISAIPTSPTSYILTYDTLTNAYIMVPSHLLGGAASGISDAPIDGFVYGRKSAGWSKINPDWINVRDNGAIGDGVTNDSAAFQAAFTACANGGEIFVPAGKYRLNSAVSTTLAASKSFTIIGAGADNTVIYFPTGAGFNVDMQGTWSSIHVRDMTLTTGSASDSTVGFRVAQLVQNAGDPASEPMSDFTNVSFRSDTGPDSFVDTNYWGYGIYIDNKSNFNIQMGYFGTVVGGARKGVGIVITGHDALGAGPSHAVVCNIANSMFAVFNVGVAMGTCTQGITVTSCNFTGGNTGLYVLAGGSNLDQLSVINSQFGDVADGVFSNSPMTNVSVMNCYFIVLPSQIGIFLNGQSNFARFIGNSFYGPGPSGNTGIDLTTTTQALISGNTFNQLSTGISLRPGTGGVNVQSNRYSVTVPIVPSTPAATNLYGGGSI